MALTENDQSAHLGEYDFDVFLFSLEHLCLQLSSSIKSVAKMSKIILALSVIFDVVAVAKFGNTCVKN